MFRFLLRRPLTAISTLLLAASLVAWGVSEWHPVSPADGVWVGSRTIWLAHGRLLIAHKLDKDNAASIAAAVDVGSSYFFETTVRPSPTPASVTKSTGVLTLTPTTAPGTTTGTIISGTVNLRILNYIGSTPQASMAGSPYGATLIFADATHYFPGVAVICGYADASVGTTVPSWGTVYLGGFTPFTWSLVNIGLWLCICISAVLPAVGTLRGIAAARERSAIRRSAVQGPVIRIARSWTKPAGMPRRIARRAFALAALGSLVICAALAAAWWLSYRPIPWQYRRGVQTFDFLELTAQAGQISGSRNLTRPGPEPEIYQERYIFHLTCGLSTYTGPNYYSWNFRLPMWVPTALAALLPAAWLSLRSRRLRWHRASRGLCANCGYDLRASPGRCPECGVTMVAV